MFELLANYFHDFYFVAIIETVLFIFGLYSVLNPVTVTPPAKRGIRREIEKSRKWGVFYMLFAGIVLIVSLGMYSNGVM